MNVHGRSRWWTFAAATTLAAVAAVLTYRALPPEPRRPATARTATGEARGFASASAGRTRRVRDPVAAGQFYPADPQQLYDSVAALLTALPGAGLRGVHAVLVPHAGYTFSAEVAAASFREVAPDFRRVFVIAGNHNGRVDFDGVSLPEDTDYAIPGANVPLSPVVDELRGRPPFTSVPEAHTMHMIEVELPFLQQLRGRPQPPDYEIVPMIAGRMSEAEVDSVAEILDSYADAQTLFVFSVDLSHYYSDAEATRLDAYTIESILSRNRQAVRRATTDADQVLDLMLALAARRGWQPTRLLARNSSEATGDTSRVVGYAAIAFHDPLRFSEDERQALLALARGSIESRLRTGRPAEPPPDWLQRHPIFRIPRGVFVTLQKNGELRGCIGDLTPSGPLFRGVIANAIKAAESDPRFPPVTLDELKDLTIEISVLDFPMKVKTPSPEDYPTALRPGSDGVILVYRGHRSTFLPEVWKQIPDPVQFLSRLSLKQGSPPDAWRDPSSVLYRYSAEVFAEPPGHAAGPG